MPMLASWSSLLVVLLAGTIALAAPARERVSEPPVGKAINEGVWLVGHGQHFDPPGENGSLVFGYALNSGQGNDPIRVAIHHHDKPSGIRTEPATKYNLKPSDATNEGFISMEHPPVIKANQVMNTVLSVDKPHRFEEMKRDIQVNCNERLVRRDSPGSCQLPKKVPTATVNPVGRKK